MQKSLLALMVCFALAACDSFTGPEDNSRVEIRFRTASTVQAAATSLDAFSPPPGLAGVSVEGTNGTLELDGVWLIVAEFELEGGENGCPQDDCHEFESLPFFVELPLDVGLVTVGVDEVPEGVYDELDFEVEDLDDDDEHDGAGASELLSEIRGLFPDWRKDASVLVTGTFSPKGENPGPIGFRVYLDAEIEIERDLSPPLQIGGDLGGFGPQELVVSVDPLAWFVRNDGSVIDLSLYDYDLTGNLLELEIEMENGFREIDIYD